MTGVALAMSNPQRVGDLFNWHQQIPLQIWGHFQPGNRQSPALSNHQIGNLRDGHKLPQPKAAKPDLWDHATSLEPAKGCQKCDSLGMQGQFSGLTKVTIYPTCTNSLQRAVVLAFPVLGPIDAGWQATQLTYKQLKHTNSRWSG